jgi:hypothetical protein
MLCYVDWQYCECVRCLIIILLVLRLHSANIHSDLTTKRNAAIMKFFKTTQLLMSSFLRLEQEKCNQKPRTFTNIPFSQSKECPWWSFHSCVNKCTFSYTCPLLLAPTCFGYRLRLWFTLILSSSRTSRSVGWFGIDISWLRIGPIQGSSCPRPLKIRLICSPETSVPNQPMLCNILEDGIIHVLVSFVSVVKDMYSWMWICSCMNEKFTLMAGMEHIKSVVMYSFIIWEKEF